MGSLGTAVPYGRRLLPTTVDQLAETDPSRPWASLPYDDDDLSKGYEDITYEVLANAVNKLAWFIESCLGRPTHFDTVAYIGRPDIRYQIISLAVAKVQYKVLFSSHVHTAAAHLSLMERTTTKALFSASGVLVDDILRARPMPHFVIPELDDLLCVAPTKHYPYTKSFEEAAQDPFVIMHTSGTTGHPKPILYNHAAVAALDARALLPEVDTASGQRRQFLVDHSGPRRLFVPFRHFHAICTVVLANACIFGGACWIPGLRHHLTTSPDVINILQHARIDDAFLSPAMIEDMVTAPNAGSYLSKINTLLYGGAPMNHEAAQTVAKYTTLRSQWGFTEGSKAVDLIAAPEDYDYCAFDLASSGMRMEPVKGTEGLLQMFFDRTPTSYTNLPLFHRDPDVTTWDSGDLWEAHPDPKKAPFTFRFRGRADDLISYADGSNVGCPLSPSLCPQNHLSSHLPPPAAAAAPTTTSTILTSKQFHPTHYELLHTEHPLIRTAILSGTGHRQPVLLLELHDPTLLSSSASTATAQLQHLLYHNSIAPTNARAPLNGRVSPQHVVFATAEKVFDRNVKGTVARKATIAKFEAEIEEVYKRWGDHGLERGFGEGARMR